MTTYLLDLDKIDETALAMVGGKAANLGGLSRIEGIQVPAGFCLTTQAYREVVVKVEAFQALLDQLETLKAEDRKGISDIGAKIRTLIEGTTIPKKIEQEIVSRLENDGEGQAYAIRSSATAEDLPGASFAGQQDSYLNMIGKEAILKHIRKCWASLYTDRAIIYRLQQQIDHKNVFLSVVIQNMIFPDVSGIMFTADPLNSNRKVLTIDAGFGLGEALVSGLVNADHYKVSDGRIIDKTISIKKLAVYALKNGGTQKQELDPEIANRQALTDEQILQLEGVGRKIEAHFGSPQDIEWCLADGIFYVVQSRPITTLYPVPEAQDHEQHVYVSVGHNQMMTDAIKPLGLSFFLLTTPAHMHTAGGRLFIDVTAMLASAGTRKKLIENFGHSDLLIKDALLSISERLYSAGEQTLVEVSDGSRQEILSVDFQTQIDPALIPRLIRNSETAIAELKQNIQAKSGIELFSFILDDIQKLKKILFDPQSLRVIMTAMKAYAWLNEQLYQWLGEKNAADVLSQSVPGNVTSEMGLALLDVADEIRPYPQIIAYLQDTEDEHFMEGLQRFDGGTEAGNAIQSFLATYGMRCAGEIDITKARWSESPQTFIPAILNHIKNFEPGESRRKFERGKTEAHEKKLELISRLLELPGGAQKAMETKQMIELIRNNMGYREYPKYSMVNHYFIYKQALLKEAEKLVKAGVLSDKEDIYYLTFDELRNLVNTGKTGESIINKRKEEHQMYEKLSPPRVMTSDGEIISGTYKRENLPIGAMAGMAVSSGIVEGRARVILRIEDAELESGDILVTTFTDPSWTPLFVSIKGLVTEVGGLMTHGAVIAREYGLPAVVGVEHATRMIRNGQRIRVNGTEGYVELL